MMKVFGRKVDSFSVGVGAVAAALVCVVPHVSEPVINFLTGIRNKISGRKTGGAK
jgi:hypothetical protein